MINISEAFKMIDRKDLFNTYKIVLDHDVICEYCRELTKEILLVGPSDNPQSHLCSKCFCGDESILRCDTPSDDRDILQLQKTIVFKQFSLLYDTYFTHYEAFKDDPITQNKMCKIIREEMRNLVNVFDEYFMNNERRQ